MVQVLVEGHDGMTAPSEQTNLSRHDVICIAIVDLLLKPSGIHRLVKWCLEGRDIWRVESTSWRSVGKAECGECELGHRVLPLSCLGTWGTWVHGIHGQ